MEGWPLFFHALYTQHSSIDSVLQYKELKKRQMELSRELWSLVETARAHQGSASSSSKENIVQKLSVSLLEHQADASLLSTAHTLSDAVAKAILRAAAHVQSVVVALDAVTPSSTVHLKNSLLLSDAELLSVSSSLKTFTETLTKVNVAAAAQRKGKRAKQSENPQSNQDSLLGQLEINGVGTRTGLVAHLQQAVSIQEQRVASKRLQVALAKEELALYRSELFLYGHCGVLSCSDVAAAQLAQYRSSSSPSPSLPNDTRLHQPLEGDPMRARASRDSSSFPLSTTTTTKPSRSGFGTTFRVVDGMMQKAAQTVKAASSHADLALHVAFTGSQAAVRQLLNAGTSSMDNIVMMGAGAGASRAVTSSKSAMLSSTTEAGVGAIQLPPLVRDELTKEEHVRLQEQSQSLIQMQHEATAHDAKAVEASIRELSQLTSLMNEQVMQQTEQFSILVRNTEAAHTNVQKAVGEVKKPLQAFWNPTRQLIALLWACMALLLAANWVLR